MTSEQTYTVLRQVRRIALLSDDGELTDGQLLQRFLDQRDEAAFELLMRRHGPMILGLCRRMLGNDADAEDAFQAVFVVLIRKAARFRTRRTVGDWLYGVAYHTALKARAASVKRRHKESQVRPLVAADTGDDVADILPLLDKELARLPVKYREPVVLCELQGHSRKETARQLGIPEGTLSSRLATARKLLAKRLARCGLAITAGTLTTLLTFRMATASVPPALAASTLEAVTSGATAPVAALAEGVLKAMLITKLKVLATLAVVLGSLFTGAVVWHSVLRNQARAAQMEAVADAALARARQVQRSADDAENIQGTWTLVRIEQARQEPKMDLPRGQSKVIFAADTVRLWDGTEARYTLDVGAQPKEIRLTRGEGPLTATTRAIYELKGDDLKICFNLHRTDNRPPTSFDMRIYPFTIPALYVLKRESPKATRKTAEPNKTDAEKTVAVQVRFVGPVGVMLQRFGDLDKTVLEVPCRLTFDRPGTYRLKLTNIPKRPGLELYPTVEVYAATPQTTTFLTHNAIPLEFTDEDFEKAVKGNLATRVVCLDPNRKDQTFTISEAPTNGDVVDLAKMKGPILLVTRLGSIDLGAKKDDDEDDEIDYRAALVASVRLLAAKGEMNHVKAILAKHPGLELLANDPVRKATLTKETREASILIYLSRQDGKTIYRIDDKEITENQLVKELRQRIDKGGKSVVLLEAEIGVPHADLVKVLDAARMARAQRLLQTVPDRGDK